MSVQHDDLLEYQENERFLKAKIAMLEAVGAYERMTLDRIKKRAAQLDNMRAAQNRMSPEQHRAAFETWKQGAEALCRDICAGEYSWKSS